MIKTLPSVRQHNQHAILQLISEKQISSRTEISKLLHMSKPAVTDNLLSLLEMGIVQEIGEGPAARSGGRKPIMLQFNPEYKYIIAIDLNFKKPIFSLGNLNGTILNQFTLRIPERIDSATRISLVENSVETLLSAQGIHPGNLAYIVISMPGIIREADYQPIFNAQFKPWFDCNLSETLTGKYGCNTLIRNDVKMATMGEFYFGAGRGHTNLFYLSCGIGLGSAFILDNHLHEGLHQASGGIERFISQISPTEKVTLEERISIDGMVHRFQSLAREHRILNDDASVGFDDIVEAYQNEDALARQVLEEIGEILGHNISNICNLLDIEQAILGGEYIVFQELLIPVIQKIVTENTLFGTTVKAATLGRNSGTFGMLETARQTYFEEICKQ